MNSHRVFRTLALFLALSVILSPLRATAPVPTARADDGRRLARTGGLHGLAELTADTYASWVEVGTGSATGGGISVNSSISWFPSLTIAPDGTPYVAWEDAGGSDPDWPEEIYVRRWNGSAWEEVGAGSATGGGISNNGGCGGPSLAVAPDGTPYVVWANWDAIEIFILRWNGSSWEEVGAGSATLGISGTDGQSMYPTVAIAPDGTPYVAWVDWQDTFDVLIRRWNGSTWEEVGTGSGTGQGISNNSGWSAFPSAAVAPDGTPYVAWQDDTSGNSEIYVRRWNGSIWEEVGPGSATGGGISNNAGASIVPSVTIAPDGTPYVAWANDTSGDSEIYVRRWNGSIWEEVGPGSATGGGISNNAEASTNPSVATALDGTPYVAWQDGRGVDAEIYGRRWNGSTWEEAGPGSATGGGISNSSKVSEFPSSAIAPDGTAYVAWHDNSVGNNEIYVRRYYGLPVNHPPTVGPATPNAGCSDHGVEQVFTTTYSDPDGWQDLGKVRFAINDTLSPVGGFYATYHEGTDQVYLIDDAGTAWIGPSTPGSAGPPLENSYASLDVATMTVSGSGDDLIITWPVTFKAGFGAKSCGLYLVAIDDSDGTNGWERRGTWCVGQSDNDPPSLGPVLPKLGCTAHGVEEVFTTTFTDPDGWENLRTVRLLINETRGPAGGFYATYSQDSDRVRLIDDAGADWIGPRTPGVAGPPLENSYVSLDVENMTVTGSGNDLTITWPVTFKPAYGEKASGRFTFAMDDCGAKDGLRLRGWWWVGANDTPAVGTVTPDGGGSEYGVEQVFTTTFIDADGCWNLRTVRFMINDDRSGAGGFYGAYRQNLNRVYLADDAGTGWVGPGVPGTAGPPLENSYVSLDVAGMTVSEAGPELTITWPVTFKPGCGEKSCQQYLLAKDDCGPWDGWRVTGEWDVGPPTFEVMEVSPPNASNDIVASTMVSASFDKDVDFSTVGTRTFTVRGSQTAIYTGTYAIGSVQFDPTLDFKPGEAIVVNLSDGLQSVGGTPLKPYAWGFRRGGIERIWHVYCHRRDPWKLGTLPRG